ncbi:phosphatase PAP2 family protein [Streptomyces sp. NPDC052207]|uniref:phosphatase PAP2 family protein n=1 Tax=Streptomyces sp. NPDC052207 TaxID=3155418 RepID=UPI00343058B6
MAHQRRTTNYGTRHRPDGRISAVRPPCITQLTIDHTITRILDWIYVFGHWPDIVPGRSPTTRSTYRSPLRCCCLARSVWSSSAAFRVSPPRLAGLGLTDTNLRPDTYRALQLAAFVHQYGATPGLRVAWSLLSMLALLTVARKVRAHVTVLALTPSTDAACVLTADHYMVNVIEGAVPATVNWHPVGRLPTWMTNPAAPDPATEWPAARRIPKCRRFRSLTASASRIRRRRAQSSVRH